jgi:hypothetical protein
MASLCLIIVPGLDVSSDWRLVHDRLLDEFPVVMDVLPTTMRETVLVVYQRTAPGDPSGWLDTVSETLLSRRHNGSGDGAAMPSRRTVGQTSADRSSRGGRGLAS